MEELSGYDTARVRAIARRRLQGKWAKSLLRFVGAYALPVAAVALIVWLFLIVPSTISHRSYYQSVPSASTILWVLGIAIQVLLLCPLEMGVYRYSLRVAQGKPATIRDLFGFFGRGYWRAIGMSLTLKFKLFFWTIPGLLVMLLSIPTGSVFLIYAGVILWVVLWVMAYYRFRLIPYVWVENPGRGIGSAIASGIELSAGMKWQFFVVDFTTALWLNLVIYVLGQLDDTNKLLWLVLVLNVVFLVLTVYMYVAQGVMYAVLAEHGKQVFSAETLETPVEGTVADMRATLAAEQMGEAVDSPAPVPPEDSIQKQIE